jgi:hypothetical protein
MGGRMFKRSAIILMPAMLSILLMADVSIVHAIDPRFEINPNTLKRNLPASAAMDKSQKGSRTPGAAVVAKDKKQLSNGSAITKKVGETRRGEAKTARGKKTGRRHITTAQAPRGNGSVARTPRRYPGGAMTHRMSLLRMSSSVPGEAIEGAKNLWGKLLPEAGTTAAFSLKGESFSLDLDPKKYPVFTSYTGKKIVVENGSELSPFVKNLMEQREPGVKFVQFRPGEPRRFLGELLNSAGFFSVEENFSVSFGSDPKLTVNSDYKVEKDQESSLQNDIFLLNATHLSGYPGQLAEFLAEQGFKALDLYPGRGEIAARSNHIVDIVTEDEPAAMVDRLLAALNLRYEKNKGVDILNLANGGVGLKVRAERYFEKNGERYVIGVFNGDPENYTLLRLLESLHYNVVMLTPEDDFKRVSDMIISRLHIPIKYEMHELVAAGNTPYSIEVSGIMIDSGGGRGRVFLTEKMPDPVIMELLKLNGYNVRIKGEKASP